MTQKRGISGDVAGGKTPDTSSSSPSMPSKDTYTVTCYGYRGCHFSQHAYLECCPYLSVRGHI